MTTYEGGLEKRFIFVVKDPHFGQRVLGSLEGYRTMDELNAECQFYIENNKRDKIPCWIVETVPVKKLS